MDDELEEFEAIDAEWQHRVSQLENAIMNIIEQAFFEEDYHGDETAEEFFAVAEKRIGKPLVKHLEDAAEVVMEDHPKMNLIELINQRATETANSRPSQTGEE